MKMKPFADRICAAIKEEMGAGYQVTVTEVRKNNGVMRHGMTIRREGMNVFPTVYLEPLLELYNSGESFDAAVQTVLDLYKRNAPAGSIDMDFFQSFENVRDRICFRLVSQEQNRELLKDIPHIKYMDLAVCFYYAFQNENIPCSGSILIHNSHTAMWGVGMLELYNLAERNTPRLFPWEYMTLGEAMAEMLGLEENGDMLPGAELSLKVLSNKAKEYGAACILYPGVLEGLAEKAGVNLYVIPSSIHETLLLADTGTYSADIIREIVAEINREQVPPEQVLSDNVYYYDIHMRQLHPA